MLIRWWMRFLQLQQIFKIRTKCILNIITRPVINIHIWLSIYMLVILEVYISACSDPAGWSRVSSTSSFVPWAASQGGGRRSACTAIAVGRCSGSGSQLATTLVNRYFYHSFPLLLLQKPLLAILIQQRRVWHITRPHWAFWIKQAVGCCRHCRWWFKPSGIFNFATSMHQFVLVFAPFPYHQDEF